MWLLAVAGGVGVFVAGSLLVLVVVLVIKCSKPKATRAIAPAAADPIQPQPVEGIAMQSYSF